MAVHKAEPFSVPPPRSVLPTPGIGFLSSPRAKSKDLSEGSLTPTCILITSPPACAENKLGAYCVTLAPRLRMNAPGETRAGGVPGGDPPVFPRPFPPLLPARISRVAARCSDTDPHARLGGRDAGNESCASPCLRFPSCWSSVQPPPTRCGCREGGSWSCRGRRHRTGLGAVPEPKLLFGELNFTPGAEPRHRGELRSHACQGRRCAELRSRLVYFACVFMSGGVYKYCSPVPDGAGVVLRAGAKLDLALPGGNNAYLLARRWVGTAQCGRHWLSRTGVIIIKINKSKSSSAATTSPMLTS